MKVYTVAEIHVLNMNIHIYICVCVLHYVLHHRLLARSQTRACDTQRTIQTAIAVRQGMKRSHAVRSFRHLLDIAVCLPLGQWLNVVASFARHFLDGLTLLDLLDASRSARNNLGRIALFRYALHLDKIAVPVL